MGRPTMSAQRNAPRARPNLEEGTPMTGTIKSYQGKNGYGFIQSPSLQGDIYFKHQAGGVEPGMQVNFLLHYAPDGKPQARDVVPAPEMTAGDGDTLIGTVKSFNDKTGYGFVVVEGQPQDFYFKKISLPAELQAMAAGELKGMQLTFGMSL